MKKNYLFTLLLTLCFSAVSFGQSTLKFQDFESDQMIGHIVNHQQPTISQMMFGH